jgi:hypothetical protein
MSNVVDVVLDFINKHRIHYINKMAIEFAVLIALYNEETKREMERCVQSYTNEIDKIRCILKVAGVENKWHEIINDMLLNICSDHCFKTLGLDELDDEYFEDDNIIIDTVVKNCRRRCLKRFKHAKHIYNKIKSVCNNDECIETLIDIIAPKKHSLLRKLLEFIRDFNL